MGENALLFPPGGATDDFITVCKTCRLHVLLGCCGNLTLLRANLPASPSRPMPWNPW